MSDNLVSVKEEDFLDEDPPLRGQNYVCLSFISPEEVIKRKDVYLFEKFVEHFSSELNDFFDGVSKKYPEEIDRIKSIQSRYDFLFNPKTLQDELSFFINSHPEHEKQYFEQNNFQTCVRGIKVRGVFDTMREAEIRSQVLKKIDNKFNVYVAQVGCWCPWSPNPDDIANQEYAETVLNTLMKNYKSNQAEKDYFYEERKKELQTLKVKQKIEESDPWLKNKETAGISNISLHTMVDAPVDTLVDAPADAPVDAPVDALADAPVDAPVNTQ